MRRLFFLYLTFFINFPIYAQVDAILDKIFKGAELRVRAEKRTLPFKPSSDIQNIFQALKEQWEKKPKIFDEIAKHGLEVYINNKLLSAVELSSGEVEALKNYVHNFPYDPSEEDIIQLLNYLKKFIKETKKKKKEQYRIKVLKKIIQIRLKEYEIELSLEKIKIIPIDVNTLIREAENEVNLEIPAAFANKQLEKDKEAITLKGVPLFKYHVKRFLRSTKTTLSSIYVKPEKNEGWRNTAIKAPGIVGSIIASSMKLSEYPLAAFTTGAFTIALNVAHSIYASTILNFHDRLAKKNKLLQITFEFLYTRAIEIVYRMIKYSLTPTDSRLLSTDFGIKVVLNSTLGALFGAMGYRGWNRLVQKGILSRQEAGRLSEGALNFYLLSQLATGFSGDPFWDILYLITFTASQATDSLVWFFSKILPAKPKIIMLSLGDGFDKLPSYKKQKIQKKLLETFAQKHGFIFSDSFNKIPQIPKRYREVKNMFVEYNILLAKELLEETLKRIENGESLYSPPKNFPVEYFLLTSDTQSSPNLIDILFHENFGLFPVLMQNIEELSSNSSFFDEILKILPKLKGTKFKKLINKHKDLEFKALGKQKDFVDITERQSDLIFKLLAVARILQSNKILKPEQQVMLRNIYQAFYSAIQVNFDPCISNLKIFSHSITPR